MNSVEQFSSIANYAASGVRTELGILDLNRCNTIGTHRHHIKYYFEDAEKTHQFINLAIAAMAALVHLSPNIPPEEFASQMTNTYRRKNADYGDSFARSLDKYGIVAAFVRISDKVNRLESLMAPGRKAQVKDESVQDTLLDLASYAIMVSMWVTEPIDKELEKNKQPSTDNSK